MVGEVGRRRGRGERCVPRRPRARDGHADARDGPTAGRGVSFFGPLHNAFSDEPSVTKIDIDTAESGVPKSGKVYLPGPPEVLTPQPAAQPEAQLTLGRDRR